MRFEVLLICFGLAACTSISGNAPSLEVQQPPRQELVLSGLKAAVAERHFDQPIEVTDLMRAPSNFTPQWMICFRSAKSEEAKRITYSVFFNSTGYVSSRYSVVMDHCAGQSYHLAK
jgi:hypothetical protein